MCPAAPGEFTADFQIAAPASGAIVSSVTTNQPVYQAGRDSDDDLHRDEHE